MHDLEPKPLAKKSAGPGLQASAVSRHAPRILIIEDELLIALMIEEMVRDIGYRVSGVAHTIAMATREFAKRNYDSVLLDINIGGRFHAEIADQLVSSGIPFAFVTGYDYLVDPRHEKIPVLQKPFMPAHLRALLETLVGPGKLARANGF
jgi:DNA-binding response OmpR family regulator